MCGRYYVDEESNQELLRIIRNLDKRLQGNASRIKTGEVYPTNQALVYHKGNQDVSPAAMTWGYPGFQGSKVIINARGESVREKHLFSNSFDTGRIVVPASGFYEWDHTKSKQKYYFTSTQASTLYMAGFYEVFEGVERFVIVTTSANDSMKVIHNRMPLLLEQNQIEPWVFSTPDAITLLHQIPSPLKKELIKDKSTANYEQLTLPFE